MVTAVDFFPTFTSLAGVTPPAVAFDGVDMSAAFLGEQPIRDKPVFWDYGRDETFLKPGLEHDQSPNLAVRDGSWKLLMNDDGSRIELYDFSLSPDETDNVAEQHPDQVKRLSAMLLEWRRSLPALEPGEH
jgi:arylsulfatase A-like enzyme